MPLQPPEPYLPRRIAPLGLWHDDERALKAYAIQRDPDPAAAMLADAVAAAARDAAFDVLRAQAGPRDHDLGYVIVHVGEEAVWLLVDWWISGGIVCQRMLSAPLARPTQFEPVTAPALACVWEFAVIAHEREAWIRHMLRAAPDARGYLDDMMAAGRY
ncbi:hypothetical protein ACILG0_11750 [Pseudomonadota bacterium AL_CKDN230030165-1A_HGKHYDSX7]